MSTTEPHIDKILLTPEEAAERLSITRSRLYDLLRSRELVSVKLGKVRRISVAALERYVEKLEQEAGA